jgi:hypothetical protein
MAWSIRAARGGFVGLSRLEAVPEAGSPGRSGSRLRGVRPIAMTKHLCCRDAPISIGDRWRLVMGRWSWMPQPLRWVAYQRSSYCGYRTTSSGRADTERAQTPFLSPTVRPSANRLVRSRHRGIAASRQRRSVSRSFSSGGRRSPPLPAPASRLRRAAPLNLAVSQERDSER